MASTTKWVCKYCSAGDGKIESINMPEGFKHHLKAICATCKHFYKWLPNPTTIQQLEKHRKMIDTLQTVKEKLPPYEATFINDLTTKSKFTPRQIAFLEKTYLKYAIV